MDARFVVDVVLIAMLAVFIAWIAWGRGDWDYRPRKPNAGGNDWSDEFQKQLDEWEKKHVIGKVECIKIGIEFNERASQMLNELCEWRKESRCDALRKGMVLYHFVEAKRQEGTEVFICIRKESEEDEYLDLS